MNCDQLNSIEIEIGKIGTPLVSARYSIIQLHYSQTSILNIVLVFSFTKDKYQRHTVYLDLLTYLCRNYKWTDLRH